MGGIAGITHNDRYRLRWLQNETQADGSISRAAKRHTVASGPDTLGMALEICRALAQYGGQGKRGVGPPPAAGVQSVYSVDEPPEQGPPVNIRQLIRASLLLPLVGCYAGVCSQESDFELVDEPLLNPRLGLLVEDEGFSDPSEMSCELLCEVWQDAKSASVDTCELQLYDDGDSAGTISCTGTGSYSCDGRRPLGHVEARRQGNSAGAYLANCALLEAASVEAFEQLAAQLESWGAPAELIARCRQAAEEERRHAEAVAQLAEARGAPSHAPACEPAGADLQAVALHNAVEGCVHETWAALAAHWRAKRAEDADVREAYQVIAEEETRHAQLAWDLHRWLLAQLSPVEQATVQAAQATALSGLQMLAGQQAASAPASLGFPTPQQTRAVAAHFSSQLLAAGGHVEGIGGTAGHKRTQSI